MIVLQVIPELHAGGAERTTLEIVQAIKAGGGRALVASEGGRMEGELSRLGGELIRLPLKSKNPLTIWRNSNKLAAIIRQEGVEIVHARSRAPAWSAKWAAEKTGAHFVTTYHGTYNAKSKAKRWYNGVMAAGERVIANSTFIRDHVIAEYPETEPRLVVIPRGVDFDRYDPDGVTAGRLQGLSTAWKLEPDRPVVLLPARLTAWKGQREAIEALGLMRAAGEDVPMLVMAGDAQGRDGYVKELEALISQHGLETDVRIVGHCSDMPAAFKLASLVLTPSVEPEAFGRTAAEAGAMMRRVIASDHGGAREVIIEGETGWRVEPGNPQALADVMRAALKQPYAEAENMGRRAAAHVAGHFSTKSLQASTLRVYEEVLNSNT